MWVVRRHIARQGHRFGRPRQSSVVVLPDYRQNEERKYVMPGIINLHGHIGNTVGLKQDASFFTRESIESNLKTYATYGVTTVLSMGTDQDLIFKVRDEERPGRPSMARVYTAGQGFVYKGGYGGLAGVNPGVATVAEVEPAVAALAAKKVDGIKLRPDRPPRKQNTVHDG